MKTMPPSPHTTCRWLPFASMNLLRHPLGELSQVDRVQAAVTGAQHWAEHLQGSARSALQFMGRLWPRKGSIVGFDHNMQRLPIRISLT